MNWEYFLLSIIQAITEFLPVSSSGHLILAGELLGIREQGLEAFLHLPTALAILTVSFATLWNYRKDINLIILIAISAIPAGLIGFLLGDYIDFIFYSPIIIAINQIGWGIYYLFLTNGTKLKTLKRDYNSLSRIEALKIGFYQILALIPGTSRSGITTIGGIHQGLKVQSAAMYSFIIGLPLIAAASGVGLYKLISSDSALITSTGWPTIIAGGLLSYALGIIFMKLFVSLLSEKVLRYSGIYRIIVGLLIVLWLL